MNRTDLPFKKSTYFFGPVNLVFRNLSPEPVWRWRRNRSALDLDLQANVEPDPGVRCRAHSVPSTMGQTAAEEKPVVPAAILAAVPVPDIAVQAVVVAAVVALFALT